MLFIDEIHRLNRSVEEVLYPAMEDYSVMESPQTGDAYLIIGDKCFDYEGRFAYTYDLAEEWIAQTRLPFVFAVWVLKV